MNALEWVGIGGLLTTVGFIAGRAKSGAAAVPDSSSDLPVPGPSVLGSVQSRPLPSGWFSNPTQTAAIDAIAQTQLSAVGFPCTDLASCATALANFARNAGLAGDPSANEASATAAINALDDKYRLTVNLPAVTTATSSGLAMARYRGMR